MSDNPPDGSLPETFPSSADGPSSMAVQKVSAPIFEEVKDGSNGVLFSSNTIDNPFSKLFQDPLPSIPVAPSAREMDSLSSRISTALKGSASLLKHLNKNKASAQNCLPNPSSSVSGDAISAPVSEAVEAESNEDTTQETMSGRAAEGTFINMLDEASQPPAEASSAVPDDAHFDSDHEANHGGSKGGSPSTADFGSPKIVAGPISGLNTTGHPVVSDATLAPKRARRGRPRSGKIKITVALGKDVAQWVENMPPGTRGQIVEMALRLVIHGPGIQGMVNAIEVLEPLSIRLQQLLELMLDWRVLSTDEQILIRGEGSAAVLQISKLLKTQRSSKW